MSVRRRRYLWLSPTLAALALSMPVLAQDDTGADAAPPVSDAASEPAPNVPGDERPPAADGDEDEKGTRSSESENESENESMEAAPDRAATSDATATGEDRPDATATPQPEPELDPGAAGAPAAEGPEAAVASPNPSETEDTAGSAKEDEDPGLLEASVDRFRQPVDRLTEHYLGSTSRPVRFDWRNAWFAAGITGSELIERNNFGSFKVGAFGRKAFLGLMVEGAISYVFVLGTESSNLLALTPYRQPSRPSRVEFDLNLSYPLFEGVVTPLFDFLPASEMVISATGAGRYLFYYETVVGDRRWQSSSTWTDTETWRSIGESLATARMLDEDVVRLERDALGGMAIDPALVHTLAGITLDAYYQPGIFFSARALLGIPVLGLVSGSQLGFWWELTLRAGWAF